MERLNHAQHHHRHRHHRHRQLHVLRLHRERAGTEIRRYQHSDSQCRSEARGDYVEGGQPLVSHATDAKW